jgi:hypothetical protein
MITFDQHINEICKAHKITDAEQIASVKRWYNQGSAKVKKKLMRRVNAETIYTKLEPERQSYQLPEYAGRVYNARYNKSGSEQRLIEISSHDAWLDFNSNNSQHGTPQFYHMISEDEIQLFPIPDEEIENGLEIALAFKHSRLTAADISTGTATVSNGSQTVTLSSSIVTTGWVGRWFTINDGHEEWHRISEYVSSTSFKIENYFDGTGGAGLNYIVGEIVDIPEEYIDLPEVYAIAKYVGVYRKSRVLSRDMMQEFNDAIKEIKQDYANPGKSRTISHKNKRAHATAYAVAGTPWYFEDQLS